MSRSMSTDMLDLKIVGGAIVDGSGRPGFRGDVGVKDGRIVALGKIEAPARETLDATDRIVAPGFIDVHTHYDAQVFWDPTLSPSCYHGVTTIVGGFCGFSVAPISPQSAKYIKPMLARVEGMPLETLDAGVPWNWSTFGDYLSRLDGKVGLNAGFFAGHSAIRRLVMGERAVGQKATPHEVEKMKEVLGQSLSQGALGFSTTVSPTHNDGDGNPVPSRWADSSEFMELARVVSQHEGTGLELLPDNAMGSDMRELLANFSIAGNRPVNWNIMIVTGRPDTRKIVEHQLEASDFARERGGEVIALTASSSPELYMSLRSGFTFDALPGVWREIFKWPIEQRIERFKDPALRKQMAADADRLAQGGTTMEVIARLAEYTVVSGGSEATRQYEGRKIREIAATQRKQPIDAMLDIAVTDGLATIFSPDIGGHDQVAFELRGRLWADDRTLIGASDAGAHLDLIDSFAFSTTVLQKGVREHKVISLEAAVHQMTQRPAAYFGFIDRGLVTQGYHADLVVFDPATVGRGPTYSRYDLPGGHNFRLYADALGIDHVFVNGARIVSKGVHTGVLAGTVLRSGKDTRTVPLDALRNKPSAPRSKDS